MIECKNIKKTYYTNGLETPVLKGVSFTIRKGEFVAIMGPSGSGKSTLMHILGALDAPTSGDGRIKSNIFKDNTINANTSVAVKIQQADSNIFEDNTFTGNTSYVAEITDSDDNVFKGNTLTGNTNNYFYAKSDAVNIIQDSDSFAVKIGDTLSSMVIDSGENLIYQNSKSLSTTAYPLNSTIILNKSNASSSIVTFSQLNFSAIPAEENIVIKPVTWNTGEDLSKKWTAINSLPDSITISYVVGDLTLLASYNISVNGTLLGSFSADSNGEIIFDYTGVFENPQTFEVKAS